MINVGDIMIRMGDIISTVGVHYQYHGKYLEYLNLIAGISWKQNTRLSVQSPALNCRNMIIVLYFIALHCIVFNNIRSNLIELCCIISYFMVFLYMYMYNSHYFQRNNESPVEYGQSNSFIKRLEIR